MKNRRILCNDDGEIGGSTKPPMSIDDIQKMLATYEGSPVDALLWCIGDHEVYEYATEVGERFGTELTQFKDERTRWRSENLDHMIKTTGGPLTSMIQACREASMDIFASVRMTLRSLPIAVQSVVLRLNRCLRVRGGFEGECDGCWLTRDYRSISRICERC